MSLFPCYPEPVNSLPQPDRPFHKFEPQNSSIDVSVLCKAVDPLILRLKKWERDGREAASIFELLVC